MDSTWLVPVSLCFGILLGGGVVGLLLYAVSRGERARRITDAALPDGIDAVIDALESAGVVVDGSNNVVKTSPTAVAFGLVWNQELVHPELITMIDRVRRSGEPQTDLLELSRGPFGEAALHLSVRVARLGLRHVLLLAEDHSESQRLDAVRRDFIANISHELKTPIGAVGLLAEALQSASDEPEQVKRFAQRLTREADRLARITQEIIDLSRLQAVDSVASSEPVEVSRVVRLALDQVRVEAESRGVSLVTRKTDATVYGDEGLLVTALHNLVANAIQYSPSGSRVGIGVSHADGVVEIAVTDQGPGIAEDDLDRVFERFFRADPARSRRTGGSGLGLSIVKHVVQNHGGDVRVWSQLGRGSTFTIRLPEAAMAASVHQGELA